MAELNISPTLLDTFEIQEQLGESNGIYTYHVKDKKSNKAYVLKHLSFPASEREIEALRYTGAIPTDEDAKRYYDQMSEDYLAQLKLLDKLSESINLAKFSEYRIIQKEDGIGFDLYLVSPMRETLEQFLDRTPMLHLTAANLAIDLCSALASLRECGLIHCNIKPSNVYLNEQGHFMLGDLGLYRIVDLKYASVPDRMIGAFSAPELFDVFSDPTSTSDIYSIGLILYNIYNGGHHPFEDEENPQKVALERRVKGETLPSPIFADYELTEILLKACAFRPEDRYQTPEELRDAFSQYVERNHLENTMIVPTIVTDEDSQITEEAMHETVEPLQLNDASQLDETFVAHFSPDISAQPEETDEPQDQAEHRPEDAAPETVDEPVGEPEVEADAEPGEPAASENADSDTAKAPEIVFEEQKPAVPEAQTAEIKKKRKFPVWAWILCSIALLALAAGAALYFLTPNVNDVSLKERTTETITLTLDADCTASDITMYATDSYGNVIVGEPDGQDILFRALTPGTQYTFHIETLRGYPVRGAREYTATTLDSIDILYFTAKPLSPTQAELSFHPAGGDSESWQVTYSDGAGEENSLSFTGHSVVLTDLQPDHAYTMTLSSDDGLKLSGQTQINFNNSDLVRVTNIVATTSATEASLTWEAEGEPAGNWIVLCYDGDEKKSEQTSQETSIVITELEEKHDYLIEIYSNGMKRTAQKQIRTNGTNLSELKAEPDGGTAVLTWICEPAIPEGYKVSFAPVGFPDAAQELVVTESAAVLDRLLPNCSYHVVITSSSGEILGGTNELTFEVPDAGRFTRYGFDRAAMRLYRHPDKENWNADDLTEQLSAFAKGSTVAFAVETLSRLKNSTDAISINYVIRNADGNVVDFGENSMTWNSIWIGNLYVSDSKRPLETEGTYLLEVYFDRQLIASQSFTVA